MIENKGPRFAKESQEAARGCKSMKRRALARLKVERSQVGELSEKLGGNADGCENKGVAKIATQKLMKLRELKIDRLRDAVRVAEGRRDETGTLSAEPCLTYTASVTICQVRN
jgi:hypothetical protein